MRRLILAFGLLVAAMPMLPATAEGIMKVQSAAPSSLFLEPGQTNVRVALQGRDLDQATGGAAFRNGRLVNDLRVTLGAKSPALRDLFVSVAPTALPGDYNLAVALGTRTFYLPVIVRVGQPRPESGRRVPDAAATEAARRNQDAATSASILGR